MSVAISRAPLKGYECEERIKCGCHHSSVGYSYWKHDCGCVSTPEGGTPDAKKWVWLRDDCTREHGYCVEDEKAEHFRLMLREQRAERFRLAEQLKQCEARVLSVEGFVARAEAVAKEAKERAKKMKKASSGEDAVFPMKFDA